MEHSLSKEDLKKHIDELDRQYHELGYTTVSDGAYDDLKSLYESKYATLSNVGYPVCSSKDETTAKEKTKTTKLPYYMGSMNKKKDVDSITKWSSTFPGPFAISDKLDGVSALYINGRLLTRGNGHVGRDVSHLLSYLKLPKLETGVCVRGELIISRLNFNKLVDEEVLTHRSIPRNTVAGCVNAVSPNLTIVESIDFVAFELLNPRLNRHEQTEYMKRLNMNVSYTLISSDVSFSELSDILKERKKHSRYEIDGVVVEDCSVIHGISLDTNPLHAFAFKLSTISKEASVKYVEWNISKDALAKPTVILHEIELDGIKISRATGFNARFITDNEIGPGTLVEITRSGEVIPHILRVISGTKADLPEYEYAWNANSVDIIVTDTSAKVQKQIHMRSFQNTVDKLEIKGLRSATTGMLYDAGITDLRALFSLTKSKLEQLNVAGFKQAKTTNLLTSIQKAKESLTCVQLMCASNCFGKGFSYGKLSVIYDTVDNLFIRHVVPEELSDIQGIGLNSATRFVQNIPYFKRFLIDNNLESFCVKNDRSAENENENTKPIGVTQKLSGASFCFSGGVIHEALELVDKNGGSVTNRVSTSCSYLIVTDKSRNTTKKMLAVKNGIKVIDIEDLKRIVS